jgi:(E)-4-hydroxy-3-methylbut-2-enyl-diphosphate synthase
MDKRIMEMPVIRRQTRSVAIKNLVIGGGAPVSVQSMTSLPIENVEGTIDQINRLAEKGAALVRCAMLTVDASVHLKEIIRRTSIPLCADIHFDYRIALAAIKAGVHKLRLNPGNIGSADRTREVVRAAKERGIPIRIGVNAGSVDRTKYPDVTPQALVDSALSHVQILEDLDFQDIVVSIKASDIPATVQANRIFSSLRDYPLHIGLTEAGYGLACIVSSAAAIGALLADGIGDTIRVSMTGDPVEEITTGYEILKSFGLVSSGIRMIACPTCGRTDPTIDLSQIARQLEDELTAAFADRLKERGRILTVAVMGCEVNGPGEAMHADVGIAGARSGNFLVFSRGKKQEKIPLSKVSEKMHDLVNSILSEVKA